MTGSKKQIEWAENIKAGIDFSEISKQFSGNEAALKVVEYIENIESANFWIDHRDCSAMDLLRKISGTGLQVKGFGFSNLVKADANAKMTETWVEIVADGRGGYKKEFSRSV